MRTTKEIIINGITLETILESHKKWLNNDGERANLRYADLSNADLRYADLRYADLSNADLSNADLSNADLRYVNLRYANLSNADLSNANLRYANLENVEYNELTAFFSLSCPDEGLFIAWKKGSNQTLIKLEIPASAKRSSATSYKCRASKVKVLAIYDEHGNEIEETKSTYDSSFIYRVGETLEVKDFDNDRWNECSTGIHFFMSKDLAKRY